MQESLQQARMWKVMEEGNVLEEVKKAALDMEQRLEEWLEANIGMLDPGLLVIGRQVSREGGVIDLLCIDREGNLVIVELKRGEVPRTVVAQVLDYASAVNAWSNERILEIANRYLASRIPESSPQDPFEKSLLEVAFEDRFPEERFPEQFNARQRMYIVSTDVDDHTWRMVEYLSEIYGVDINVAVFHFFRDESGQEYLVRTFMLNPEEVEDRARSRSGLRRKLSVEELRELAQSRGVGELYARLEKRLSRLFRKYTTRSSLGLQDDRHKTVFSLIPKGSDEKQGLKYSVYTDRFAEFLSVEKDELIRRLPRYHMRAQGRDGEIGEGFFRNLQEVEDFLNWVGQRRSPDVGDQVL